MSGRTVRWLFDGKNNLWFPVYFYDDGTQTSGVDNLTQLEQRIDSQITLTPFAVTTAGIALIGENPARKKLGIVNRGPAIVDIFFGGTQAGAFGQGWPCGPAPTAGGQGGGFYDDQGPDLRALFAISQTGTVNIVVLEGS